MNCYRLAILFAFFLMGAHLLEADSGNYRTALSIAGSDPSGGAGLQADLKTFSALECYGMTVVTALTAQNTTGVQAVHSLPAEFIRAELQSIFDDIEVHAIKIGMLQRKEIIEEVATFLQAHRSIQNIVLDPVMVAKNGDSLIEDDAVAALSQIFPLTTVITPNVHEACRILDIPEITNEAEMEKAALALLELGPKAVVIKGSEGRDCLVVNGENRIIWLESPYIMTNNIHGTGCTFSAAITAFLAQGNDIVTAVKSAKIYIAKAIEKGANYTLGKGKGPVFHFHAYWPESQFTNDVQLKISKVQEEIFRHPFIQQLAEGSLATSAFQAYIKQDYLFLVDRAQAFAILASRAEDPDLADYLHHQAVGSKEAAAALFSKYNIPISIGEHLQKNAACKSYTDEMLHLATSASFNEGLLFLLPCALIYQNVGEYIEQLSSESNPYSLWIRTYSSKERRKRIEKLCEMIDSITARVSTAEKLNLQEVCFRAAQHELAFWDAILNAKLEL